MVSTVTSDRLPNSAMMILGISSIVGSYIFLHTDRDDDDDDDDDDLTMTPECLAVTLNLYLFGFKYNMMMDLF
jgi:hypothetical protein